MTEPAFTIRIGWRRMLATMSGGVLITALTLLDALAIEQCFEGNAEAWMVLPALLSAVLAVMLARTNGSWLGVPNAWIAGMLVGLAAPIVRMQLVGVDSGVGGARVIAATIRIGRFRQTKWRIPAGIIRSVRWEPDSGSPHAKQRSEWLVLLDIREEVPPELARFKQDARRTTERLGLRTAAMAIAKSCEGAGREGMRLIAFLETCGLRFELDPRPVLETPCIERRIAPPTWPDGIDAMAAHPARAAAARQRVRWVAC